MSKSEEILSEVAIEEFYKNPAESFVNPEILKSIFDDIPVNMILVN